MDRQGDAPSPSQKAAADIGSGQRRRNVRFCALRVSGDRSLALFIDLMAQCIVRTLAHSHDPLQACFKDSWGSGRYATRGDPFETVTGILAIDPLIGR